MAELNCNACEEIRQTSPEFVVNGLTDDMCLSLQNDTGLSPADSNDDCTDLHNMNDCLVGNMSSEIETYDVCDWKEFMRNFIPNLWTMIKGVICSICGMWKAIHKLECMVNALYNGAEFSFGEQSAEGKESKLVPGKGVDFTLRSSATEHSYDVRILYIAGGLARLGGSLRLFTESFKDANGVTKSGNTMWRFADSEMPKGGELLYEVRIKKSEFPQIKRLYNGVLMPTSGGEQFFQMFVEFFNEGAYAYGQHGWCDSDGTPSEEGYSQGHLVPDGWMYIQVRLMYKGALRTYDVLDGSGATKRGSNITPQGYIGIRMNQNGLDC